MGQGAGRQNGDSSDDAKFGRRLRASLTEPADLEELLLDCPRELAETLRDTGQWDALRCRPWLSAGAFRGVQRALQRCELPELLDRFSEAAVEDECKYSPPTYIPWAELDADHVVSAGQLFRRDEAHNDKLWTWRRQGLQTLRQGKLGVVLMAGGMNWRLGCAEAPLCTDKEFLRLCSGKSLMQILCERIRRIVTLCRTPDESQNSQRATSSRPSVPVFVMTSRLTHRRVLEHFEAHRYFGLPSRDVFFFEQPVAPVLSSDGHLLPQSLGGEFAHAPGGTGQVLRALAQSSALDQMRDRGIECLHIVGTENLLCRVCDPIFIGFCRELDIDCACKIAERLDPEEDLELFSVRQSPVSSSLADIEEAACGLAPLEAPEDVLHSRSITGALNFAGSINSFFFTVAFVEEVVNRPVRPRRLSRIVPYLEFHLASQVSDAAAAKLQASASGPVKTEAGCSSVSLGGWPAETPVGDFACQRALLAAAAEVRAHDRQNTENMLVDEPVARQDEAGVWRCDVDLDSTNRKAVIRIRSLRKSIQTPGPLLTPADAKASGDARLSCSLVVPMTPNALVLETSLMDYFIYTDRAIGIQVPRREEYAPVRDVLGLHCLACAMATLSELHCGWVLAAGGTFDYGEPGACLEISPLLSYEGEGLGFGAAQGAVLRLPCHLPSPEEVADGGAAAENVAEEAADGLDTRLFYMQEYPQRMQMRDSHTPQFQKKMGPGASG